jgi:hypothetical protein
MLIFNRVMLMLYPYFVFRTARKCVPLYQKHAENDWKIT